MKNIRFTSAGFDYPPLRIKWKVMNLAYTRLVHNKPIEVRTHVAEELKRSL